MRKRDVKRTCPCLYQLDGSCQNDSHTAVGGEHVIKKEQRCGNFRIFIHGGALVCYSLITLFIAFSGVAVPGCLRDVCSNITDKERANAPFIQS